MGSVTAILFNIPGRPSNAASLLDGHPLAQAGKARTALGCAASASALGSTFGILILVVALPLMQRALMLFGPLELMLLVIWGLTAIVVLSGGAVVKGLIAAGVGLLISFCGLDPLRSEPRFTFGIEWLEDGVSLVPVFLGLYALAEMFHLLRQRQNTISRKQVALSGSVLEGITTPFRYPLLFLRASGIGTLIGMIPGIGGTVASFVAYGHAAQSARDNSNFGKGDIRGLLAPEAANDAKDGGALVPTLAFGIPGGTGTAMLLAVLTLHGLEPGRQILDSQLVLVFVLLWSLFFSNWLTSLFGLGLTPTMAKLTTLRTDVIIPVLLIVASLGVYLHRGEITDVLLAYIFALLGYAMKITDWPRIPMMIALVLGPLLERNLLLSIQLFDAGRLAPLERPVALVILLLLLMVVASKALRRQPKGAGSQA